MATRLFYGRSLSTAEEEKKKVIVEKAEYLIVDANPIEIDIDYSLFLTQDVTGIDYDLYDEDLPMENDNPLDLASGDLLVCYFSHGNLHSQPWIQLTIKDSQDSSSTTEDYGHAVKTQSPDSDMSGLWSNGETLIFTYIRLNQRVGYWFLINRAIASKDYYGNVKLTDSLEPGGNSNAVMTKDAVLQLFDKKDSSQLEYDSAIIPSADTTKVGHMILRAQDGDILSEFDIYVPKIPDIPEMFSNTSDLYNDGPRKNEGDPDTEANCGAGHPFITRIVPGRLTFRNSFDSEIPVIGLTIIDGNDEEKTIIQLIDEFGHTHIFSENNLYLHSDNGFIEAENFFKFANGAEVNGQFNCKNDAQVNGRFENTLDVEINEHGTAISGRDKDLYNRIVKLGWTDCLV